MRFIVLIVLLLGLTSSSYNDAYCEGFYNGFKNGYCYKSNTYSCMPPPPPMCPIPRIGEDSYTHGYNRGFLVGLNY